MKKIKIYQVDAFTTMPFCGNPAGVVSDARGLTAEEMQKIANEMNLSETTFVFPPCDNKAEFLIRYFTPRNELAVAGHPTIATVHVLIEEGKLSLDKTQQTVWLETGAGLLPVEIHAPGGGDRKITLTMLPPAFQTARIAYEELAAMLGTDRRNLDDRYPVQKVSTGICWLVVPLRTLEAVKHLRPDLAAIADYSRREKVTGITVFTTETEDRECDLHVRAFAPNEGVAEDPVCGSGNSCVGAYMVENRLIPAKGTSLLASEQGSEIGRPGRVYIEIEGESQAILKTKISGTAVSVLSGEITF